MATRLACPVVDEELVSIGSRLVTERPVQAERGPGVLDGLPEHMHRLLGDGPPFRQTEPAGVSPGVHSRPVQDLARVDVADPGDTALVHEEALHAKASGSPERVERWPSGRRGHRIGPQDRERRIGAQSIGPNEAKQPEPTRVLEPELPAVGESDLAVNVGKVADRRLGVEEPASAHAEVGEQGEAPVELDEQVLAVAANPGERATPKSPRERRRHGGAKSGSGEPDRPDRAAPDDRIQQAADRLDLGKFGHGGTLGGVRGAVKPGTLAIAQFKGAKGTLRKRDLPPPPDGLYAPALPGRTFQVQV